MLSLLLFMFFLGHAPDVCSARPSDSLINAPQGVADSESDDAEWCDCGVALAMQPLSMPAGISVIGSSARFVPVAHHVAQAPSPEPHSDMTADEPSDDDDDDDGCLRYVTQLCCRLFSRQ